MDLPIGEEIARRRKQRGITQQELAVFMNVSKASVSKWETGQSYPDITSLPLLAAYFDCSVDELLILDSQLSPKEIQRIYQLLKDAFKQKHQAKSSRWHKVLSNAITLVTRSYYKWGPLLESLGSAAGCPRRRRPERANLRRRFDGSKEKYLFEGSRNPVPTHHGPRRQ